MSKERMLCHRGKRQFYVEFPSSSPVMSKWVNTLEEAREVAERYIADAPVIYIHQPILFAGNGEMKALEMEP